MIVSIPAGHKNSAQGRWRCSILRLAFTHMHGAMASLEKIPAKLRSPQDRKTFSAAAICGQYRMLGGEILDGRPA
jgi:hypothetical protein